MKPLRIIDGMIFGLNDILSNNMPLNANQSGMLIGGLIIVACLIVWGKADSFQTVISVSTTLIACVIFGIIGGVIVVVCILREFDIL